MHIPAGHRAVRVIAACWAHLRVVYTVPVLDSLAVVCLHGAGQCAGM